MSLKEYGVLFALGAIWGASFMFIKVAGAEMQPFFLVEVRLGLAALAMILLSASQRGTFSGIRANWLPILVMGIINCAIPYTLITWGEVYINSGLAAIYNACAPLWAAALGLVWIWAERPSVGRLLGLLAGMAGVVLVVSANLSGEGESSMQLLGQGAVLLAALSYAVAGIFGRKKLQGVPVQVTATGQLIIGAVILLPFSLLQIPAQMPSLQAIGSIATLSILGTAVASLLYYWLLTHVGATRTLLVTYLLPAFALIWGALLLHEPITLVAVAGLILILLGITITSGRGTELVARIWNREGARSRRQKAVGRRQ
jgi:drug/metabolite transporter (DMT)-like permease